MFLQILINNADISKTKVGIIYMQKNNKTGFCEGRKHQGRKISRENHYLLSETAFGKLHLAERALGG